MEKLYLYGISVSGIQSFIFKTNKLKEIIGASEIIVSLEQVEIGNGIKLKDLKAEAILNVAGHFIGIFKNKSKLENIVLNLPKKIMQQIYGIDVFQSVIPFEGELVKGKLENLPKGLLDKLNKNLNIQRNKPNIPLDISINLADLCNRTSRPAVFIDDNELIDKSSYQKIQQYKNWCKENKMQSILIDKIGNKKNKVAVIHADGNNLGDILNKIKESNKVCNLRDFSKELDDSVKKAFHDSKDEICKDQKNKNFIIERVILGGDDMTAICDADVALEFAKLFLQKFEEQTAKIKILKDINIKKITACAGIAYCNIKFPFHYAVSLADSLCNVAKSHAKKIDKNSAPSCLMFYNIKNSNFQSWEQIAKDELTLENEKGKISFQFGPYYLNQEGQPLIENFIELVNFYKNDENSPISNLRRWLGELKSEKYSKILLERINIMQEEKNKQMNDNRKERLKALNTELSNEKLIIQKDGNIKSTPIYDVLQILSVAGDKR